MCQLLLVVYQSMYSLIHSEVLLGYYNIQSWYQFKVSIDTHTGYLIVVYSLIHVEYVTGSITVCISRGITVCISGAYHCVYQWRITVVRISWGISWCITVCIRWS